MDNGNLTFFYEPAPHGRQAKIAKMKALLHKKVVLHMTNYKRHIKKHHPDMTLDIITSVLSDPDEIYRKSKNGKEFSYQKMIDGILYRVVIAPAEYNRKAVVTAYAVWQNKAEDDKRTAYCSYERGYDYNEYLKERNDIYDSITAEYGRMLACC